MLNTLVDLLPDSVKSVSARLISQPSAKVTVTFATFEYLPIQALTNPSDEAFNVNYLCLVVCTPFALEVWAFVHSAQFQRIYCKSELGLHMARYLPLIKSSKDEVPRSAKHSQTPLRELLYSALPILAVSKPTEEYASSLGIHLLSLKNSQYFHVLRFTAQLDNFVASQYVIAAMLRGGQLRIYDLDTLEPRVAIETICMSPTVKELAAREETQDSSQPGLPTGAPSLSRLLKDAIPVCDVASQLLAYVRHDVVSESRFKEMAKELMETALIHEYSFAKETTEKLFALGEFGYTKMRNLFNTRKAAHIEKDVTEAMGQSAAGSVLVPESSSTIPRPEEEAGEEFVDITPSLLRQASEDRKNQVSVIIQRIADGGRIATIVPPYFESVTLIKFSPSGTLLLLGNENAQLFYIYKLFPESNYRHISDKSVSLIKTVSLLYSIFRGYTSAKVSCVAFSVCERWLIINSAKGTSHIYRLDGNVRHIEEAITRNDSSYDYGQAETANVIKLSAFSRFRYASVLEQGDMWPATAIVSHYPLDKLGSKKEVLLRMGAIFYKSGKNDSEDNQTDIPLFVTLTNRAEAFVNALITFNQSEPQSSSSSARPAPIPGLKEYEMLQEQRFPTKENYHNDKLVVENLTKVTLALEYKAEQTQEALEKNVVAIVKGSRKHKGKPLDLSWSQSRGVETAEEVPNPSSRELIHKKQQSWLKQLHTVTSTSATPALSTLPQFSFCTWNSGRPLRGEKRNAVAEDALMEELFAVEGSYFRLGDKRKRSDAADAVLAKEEHLQLPHEHELNFDLQQEAEEEEKDENEEHKIGHDRKKEHKVQRRSEDQNEDVKGTTKGTTKENKKEKQQPNESPNPFDDAELEKDIEQRLAAALDPSASKQSPQDAEQRSTMFQPEIKVLEDYQRQQEPESSPVDTSEYHL